MQQVNRDFIKTSNEENKMELPNLQKVGELWYYQISAIAYETRKMYIR